MPTYFKDPNDINNMEHSDASCLDPMPVLGDNPLAPLLAIAPQEHPKDENGNPVTVNQAPAAPVKINPATLPKAVQTPITVLDKSCSATDVINVLIDQINGLQNDIRNLEDLRDMLKNNFLADQKAWRSTYAVDNKIKTFSGFYSTILNYKCELNKMLIQLKNIRTDTDSVSEQVKTAIKEALLQQTVEMRQDAAINKKRIEELLKTSPGLMPTSL